MLPNNRLSTSGPHAEYFGVDTVTRGVYFDYERGGVALADGSLGLDYQDWICSIAPGSFEVRVKPVSDGGAGTYLFTAADAEQFSFSFDRNMRPTVLYLKAGLYTLYWYDNLVNAYVYSYFTGIRHALLSHDDKRSSATTRSDILMCYLKDDKLCLRQTRDRYTVERVLKSGLSLDTELKNVGMTKQWRFEFDLGRPV